MQVPKKFALGVLATMLIGLSAWAGDRELIPPQFSKQQRDNIAKFLDAHQKADRFVPKDAKLVDAPPAGIEGNADPKPGQTFKQYTVQIVSHRPVPGQEEVKRADVFYYRPNPEKGKQGITIKHTVDITTGEQVGPTEVLVKHHTPMSREEVDEAVALAREKSPDVQDLYKDREPTAVRWEYLQLMVSKKQAGLDPGDRVVRLMYQATPAEGQDAPRPVKIIVNVTKGIVARDD
jgi:hypothetical protein